MIFIINNIYIREELINNDHFYREENSIKTNQEKEKEKKFMKKKSLIPLSIQNNIYNLTYQVKRHYFIQNDV